MKNLRIVSLMAENADYIVAAIADYLADKLGLPIKVIADIPWNDREALLDGGRVHAAWICGLPYVMKVDRSNPGVELLAAPVMQASRYRGRPEYYSDVVVRRDSRFRNFGDLRGASWAYNEPHSQSGYNVVCAHLAGLGQYSGFFGRVTESGAHQESLRMILDGRADASAIDSTVLEQEFRKQPVIRDQFTVLETLGPSPMPPWVVRRELPRDLCTRLGHLLLEMHRDPRGGAVLEQGHMARFASVEDVDYDPIRNMAQMAESVIL